MKASIPRIRTVRQLLQKADVRLEEARDGLVGEEINYAAATHLLVDVVQAGLRAFMTWHGITLLENASPLDEAKRAVSRASILHTSLRRVRRFVATAEPFQRRDGQPLSVSDREEVVAGFYAVRNLHFMLLGELPDEVRPESTLPPDAGVSAAGTQAAASMS